MEREALAERPHAEYERRLGERRQRIASLDRTNLRLSNLRLLIAVTAAVLLWFAFVRAALSPVWGALAWILFGIVAVVHAKMLERAERARRAEQWYERALARLAGRWAGAGRDGAAFGDGHPYARDLDLFGHASLFELLNTARTEAGESTLASWISTGADLDEVRVRQTAVDELRPRLDFREDIVILATEGEVSRTGALATWAASRPSRFPALLPIVFGGCAVIAIVLAVLAYFDVLPWTLLIFWLFVEAAIAWAWKRSLTRIIHEMGKPADDLEILAALVARVERETFASPRLAAIQAGLKACATPAGVRAGCATAIARLERLVSLLESTTHNLFFLPFTRALLVPEQLAIAIDRWHATYGPSVADWLRSVGEVEALCALATYAYEHPADPFPSLGEGAAAFDAQALKHPLLPIEAAVANDVRLGGRDGPRVIVVSGSNMSGKSTLLRAVGVNVVLALAGAPVRAATLTLSRLTIGATLRIDDSLAEGHSKFYNEILRIRAIVDAARGPIPLLFLLDEILHGTNSYDRRIGAEAIVRALVDAGAIGSITTHDLALTELPARMGTAAVNMHFEDRLENGRMVFDYRMRPGVVEHSNALALMRAIGLDV
jgi:MutS-like protein